MTWWERTEWGLLCSWVPVSPGKEGVHGGLHIASHVGRIPHHRRGSFPRICKGKKVMCMMSVYTNLGVGGGKGGLGQTREQGKLLQEALEGTATRGRTSAEITDVLPDCSLPQQRGHCGIVSRLNVTSAA